MSTPQKPKTSSQKTNHSSKNLLLAPPVAVERTANSSYWLRGTKRPPSDSFAEDDARVVAVLESLRQDACLNRALLESADKESGYSRFFGTKLRRKRPFTDSENGTDKKHSEVKGDGAMTPTPTPTPTEFDNQLLKELCRLWRIKLCVTAPLHPQRNYTERVNRYVGKTLRNLVNAPGARRCDWFEYVKLIEFAYNRKYIPGTNLSPYLVTTGRQPLTPIETDTALMDSEGSSVSTVPYASLEDQSRETISKLNMVEEAVSASLSKNREQVNQSRIEERFRPGEMVRYFKRLTARRGVADTEGNEAVLQRGDKRK